MVDTSTYWSGSWGTSVQTLSEEKRQKILTAAGELFASRPFHKVLLSDVATAAAVGKGTVYVYFKSKEELYLALLYQSFENLVDQLKQRLDADELRSPREALETMVHEFVDYAYRHPHLLELMRSVQMEVDRCAQWEQKRRELSDMVEAVIRRGIRIGQFCDPHPELTARFVPGLVRSALLDGVNGYDQQVVTGHIVRFLQGSLLACHSQGTPTSETHETVVAGFVPQLTSRPGETQHG
jgi:AcrR family transcriptional regulator